MEQSMNESEPGAGIKQNLHRVKIVLLDMLTTFQRQDNQHEIDNFEKWISSRQYLKDLEDYNTAQANETKLDGIVEDLRNILPEKHVLPSEVIFKPDVGPNSDCDDKVTQHVDEFIYDDSELDRLIDEEKIEDISKTYCGDCGSKNIKDIIMISHSLSRKKTQYIFKCLLPSDIKKCKVLDVGSRIGAVLYGAFFYSDCENIFGVEISKELCEIQNEMIQSHNMESRVKIIHSDIMNQAGILKMSDVVILNNVFEFFMPMKEQVEVWKFIKANVKKGCYLITVPSIEESLKSLGIYEELCIPKWYVKKRPHQPENFALFTNYEVASFHDVYFYCVE